ncbi:GNAT family N-acetyltransferase [Devosia ginsengisoli]|uniref:GNAT family N-acetyltransferase n=1 Tax=Devosia ginsengisoli TaxID=400770 RepID=UPI0026EA995B|nr:GNAT family N-acetyltransferase [Devosia ginsengisoli]MCR6673675.1 GNAT family N-acetyltransferase [Devosia ginsengisoli]
MPAFEIMSPLLDNRAVTDAEPITSRAAGEITAEVTDDLEVVEATWRRLQAGGIESPGQNFDFIHAWVQHHGIAREDQRYVVGCVDGEAVALLPLHRKKVHGVSVFTWFPGANVGCYAPVSNYGRLAALDPMARCLLWQTMFSHLDGADLVYLRSIPAEVGGHSGLFDELGATLTVETLYRSEYSSWKECDRLQRSKSRRKHDRQQGDRLGAMGEVSFEEVRNGGDTRCAIETMFIQRSARFKAMGIRDTFVRDGLIGFYHDLAKAGSGVDVRLHILRLNGQIVAVRYNVVHNDRMFCLISSMSDDLAIQNGSPGKQCLLWVMQTVFDQGIRVFDMGSGFTDEKRHWCNVQMPLRQHYVGLTLQGAVIVKAHRVFQKMRAAIKANPQLKAAVRGGRQIFDRITGASHPVAAEKSE